MVDVIVENDLPRALHEIEARGRNLRGILPVVADALVAVVSDVYEAEGPGWAALKPSTLKKRRGGSAQILQDTGLMAQTGRAIGPDYVEAYSPADYAVFHVRGDGGLPVRNPFDLGPFENDFLSDVENLVLDEVTK